MDDIPAHTPLSYAPLTNTPTPNITASTATPKNYLKRPPPPIPKDLPEPQHAADNPLDTMEIDAHKHLPHCTIYHVNKWRPEHLTAKQFCHHRREGLTTEHLTRENTDDEDTPSFIQSHLAPNMGVRNNSTHNPQREKHS
jgi:hypothetical protein